MTESGKPAEAAAAQDAAGNARWTLQFVVVVALLIGFGVLVVAMMQLAGGDDGAWQRRVYVFGAVEAVVFTAVGWLFGREVHRSAAVAARQDASTAKQDAAGARDEAKRSAVIASDAQRRVAEEVTKGRAVQAAVHSVGAGYTRREGPGDVGFGDDGRGQPAAVDLRLLVDTLYGPPPQAGSDS